MTEHEREEAAAAAAAPLPTHPGVFLRDVVLPEVKESKSELATRLGLSRPTFYAILNGDQAVTPETALKLGKLFGNSPRMWLNMQMAYDLAKAKAAIGEQVRAIKPVEQNETAAARPVKERSNVWRKDTGQFMNPRVDRLRSVAGSDLAQGKRIAGKIKPARLRTPKAPSRRAPKS